MINPFIYGSVTVSHDSLMGEFMHLPVCRLPGPGSIPIAMAESFKEFFPG